MLERPIKFKPYLKTVLWGGNKIAEYTGIETKLDCVGESWEISDMKGFESVVAEDSPEASLRGKTINQLVQEYGAELLGTKVYQSYKGGFPLLVKLIDAQRDLSIQVHPNDALAQQRHHCQGKTEMWYIIDSEPGAKIFCGLSQPLSPEEYQRRVEENTIMDVVKSHESAPGQFYFIPAGTIHSIGAGNLLAEIQQSSDITYRVYDYNRKDVNGNPRELHTQLAKAAIDYTFPSKAGPIEPYHHDTTRKIVNCPYFTTDFVHLSGTQMEIDNGGNTFAIIMVTEGDIRLCTTLGEEFQYHKSETVLVPAKMHPFILKGNCKCLIITMP